MAVLPITIAERLTITIASTIVSIAVVKAFKAISVGKSSSKKTRGGKV